MSKMYIKDGTRQAYNSSNRLFLLWFNSKKPQSVSDHARKVLQETFEGQVDAKKGSQCQRFGTGF